MICNVCHIDKINFPKNRKQCVDCFKLYRKKYRINNQTKISEYNKNYFNLNKEYILTNNKSKYNKEERKQRYIDNRAKLLKQYREYYHNHKSIIRDREKNKYNYDITYRLKKNISSLIRGSFKRQNYNKKSKTRDILGCSIDEFKLYLESKFQTWMTWHNYGGIPLRIDERWDIDHIIPICLARTENDVIMLNHYTNLRPLCSFNNRYIKRGKNE